MAPTHGKTASAKANACLSVALFFVLTNILFPWYVNLGLLLLFVLFLGACVLQAAAVCRLPGPLGMAAALLGARLRRSWLEITVPAGVVAYTFFRVWCERLNHPAPWEELATVALLALAWAVCHREPLPAAPPEEAKPALSATGSLKVSDPGATASLRPGGVLIARSGATGAFRPAAPATPHPVPPPKDPQAEQERERFEARRQERWEAWIHEESQRFSEDPDKGK